MFSYCFKLTSVVNTRATTIVKGNLSSKDFFTNLRNLTNLYPKNVF
jgi:hypothetical protein